MGRMGRLWGGANRKGPCPWKSAKARIKAGENWRFLASQQAPLLSTAFQNAADPTPAHSPTHVRQGSASGCVSGSARLLEFFWVFGVTTMPALLVHVTERMLACPKEHQDSAEEYL